LRVDELVSHAVPLKGADNERCVALPRLNTCHARRFHRSANSKEKSTRADKILLLVVGRAPLLPDGVGTRLALKVRHQLRVLRASLHV